MKRLVHSSSGTFRSHNISNTAVFAYVEGGLDRVFFDRLLTQACGDNIPYEVQAAKETSIQLGGKTGLLSLFEEFKISDNLYQDKFGKKTVCIFFADKDIDDHLKTMVESDHFIYTTTYDLEGHLLDCGDLSRALSDAALITKAQATDFIKDKKIFFRQIAVACKDWLALCILSHSNSINVGCNYNMNPPMTLLSLDDTKINIDIDALSARILARMELQQNEFDNALSAINLTLETEINNGNYFRFLKGKWFEDIFQKLTVANLNIADKNLSNVGEKIMQALLSQIPAGTDCSCCAHFFNSIEPLLGKIRVNNG